MMSFQDRLVIGLQHHGNQNQKEDLDHSITYSIRVHRIPQSNSETPYYSQMLTGREDDNKEWQKITLNNGAVVFNNWNARLDNSQVPMYF